MAFQRRRKVDIQEVEALHRRLRLAADRMKPHYINNVLTTIYYLCESDPERAQIAVGALSEYLRNTLETIDNAELVTFRWELNQIKNYMALESMRFGDHVRAVYDVDVDTFRIPPLTVLPLVENAVKHGIAGKEGQGTVSVITRRMPEGAVQIRVTDDGVGFDTTNVRIMKEAYQGLADVRERMKLETGAEMTIESKPGAGTTVTIHIPSQE